MYTVAQLCDQVRALTHDDLIDGVHVQIADAIQATPGSSTVIGNRLVAVHEWVESASIAARDAERNAHSAHTHLNRAIRILEGLQIE